MNNLKRFTSQAPTDGFVLYYIGRVDDAWIVVRNGRKWKLRLSVDLAVGDAIKAAIETYNGGVPAEVLFSSGKSVTTLWSNGVLSAGGSGFLDADQVADSVWAA